MTSAIRQGGVPALVDARITRIETIPLRVELERPATGSTLKLTHRCTIVTRVHTDAGVVGECFNGNDDELQPAIIRLIHDELEPLLKGRRVAAIDDAWAATRRATEPFLRDRRVALRAQACVDSALHDAVGKLAGLPLHLLWGGARERVPVVALGGYYRQSGDLEALADEVAELKAFGIHGLKLKLGGKTPAEDALRAQTVRRAGGDGFVLACDANQGWSREEALEFVRRTRDLNLAWFEEPCRWDNDRADMAVVRTVGGVPVAAGQSELSRFGCRDLLTAGAIDICNFDASWGGGPTEWRRVAMLASAFNVAVMQHLEPQIGLMMSAGVVNGRYAEVMLPWRDPFFYKLIANQPARPFVDGFYTLPTAPGWGMSFDPEYLEFARRK
ncbi:mandelate racemase/muconate lactonizing enzyme family protein [Pigmentiphaga sp. GD03639]|uniref:mandelate racemase/muconate lactonizing enzyme family protein n=1 Tax=Pigmentiphaga sp. GD03639 TaxID=2975354 RepID=UPI00244AD9F1|nr:mandelate racemase/muconate lactonizing enzyme family protein [Pigmentiphaga sp. GD03639]MDH2237828.1 mandelate racemase/muconate lactonizing enzyme family protein [Pigmentiphaga sp. GD03639]